MRRMVGDEQDVYRVIVVRKDQKKNPDFDRNDRTQRSRYWLYGPGTHEVSYGPYNTIGTARAIRTRETWDVYNDCPRHYVVSSRIEKASTTWTVVDEK